MAPPADPALASGSRGTGYAPLVPTFSPHTADADAAVRLVWRVLLVAGCALVALVTGGPVAANWYVTSAIEPRLAEMTPIDGVVFVRHDGARDWVTAGAETKVAVGDTLRTAANARAFIRLFDQSTVLLYPSSHLRILRAEQGRFRPEKAAVVLELTQGRARIGVAPFEDPSLAFFQVRSPGAEIHLQEGSYSVDVERETSQVRVRLGEATAYTPRGSAIAHAGQRLVARPDRPPLGGQPMRGDLVQNGWFAERTGISLHEWVARDVSDQDPPGAVSLHDMPDAVSFSRSGRGHGETLISQQLDIDLWDYEKVVLAAELRVMSHSLSGGGWQGSEYPLMLRVVYRDATGGVLTWYRGFYLHNTDNYPALNGVRIRGDEWHRTEIDLLQVVPRPWRIQRVEVVASGWDYASAIRELHVWAE